MFVENPVNSFIKLGCSISVPLLSIFMTYLMKWLLDCLIYNGESQIQRIEILLIGYFVVKILNVVITNIEGYAEEMNNNSVKKYINNLIISKCINLDISIYDDAETYNQIQYVHNNSSSISRMVEGIVEIFSAIISCIVIFVLGFSKLQAYALVMIVSCIPSTIAKIKYTNAFYKLGLEQIGDERKIDYLVSLILEKKYSQEVKQYSLGDMIYAEHKRIWEKLISKKRKILINSLTISSVFLFLPEICYFLIMLLIVNRIIKGELSVGDFSLYLGLITQLWGDINRVTYDIDSIVEENGKIFFLKNFMEKQPNIQNGNRDIFEIHNIRFENVYFKYPFSKGYTLNGLNLVINEGNNIAIVGENGSGKSTIIKLLLRFYDVTSGGIYINDINIKEYNIFKLRSCIGLYFQNSNNYAFSVKDNITISRKGEVINEQIKKSIEISGLDMIMKTKGITLCDYVTKLFDENGIELSGGEQQRLALSRAVYSDAGWFVFDEPSSALDPKNEYEFFEKVRIASEKRTIIYISHRLSNISLSDEVIVIENGCVKEQGTIDQLMRKKGKFYELYTYQKGNIL